MTKRSDKVPRPPEIAQFESFLKTIGFKRSDGSIFGLLVLSPEPLSSDEIGRALGLSQGGVSQGLARLSHWGAIETRYSPERRVRVHTALVDSLSIVATVFTKREKGAIEAFRRANESARDRALASGADRESDLVQRLDSYIVTCELAQVVMEFVMLLSRLNVRVGHYHRIVRALPKVLGAIAKVGNREKR